MRRSPRAGAPRRKSSFRIEVSSKTEEDDPDLLPYSERRLSPGLRRSGPELNESRVEVEANPARTTSLPVVQSAPRGMKLTLPDGGSASTPSMNLSLSKEDGIGMLSSSERADVLREESGKLRGNSGKLNEESGKKVARRPRRTSRGLFSCFRVPDLGDNKEVSCPASSHPVSPAELLRQSSWGLFRRPPKSFIQVAAEALRPPEVAVGEQPDSQLTAAKLQELAKEHARQAARQVLSDCVAGLHRRKLEQRDARTWTQIEKLPRTPSEPPQPLHEGSQVIARGEGGGGAG